jgi:hypothetical protein
MTGKYAMFCRESIFLITVVLSHFGEASARDGSRGSVSFLENWRI